MKYKIVLFIILFPFFATAQIKEHIDSLQKIQNVLNDLEDSWTLGINSGNGAEVNLKQFNKFKTLFDSNAVIGDDFNAYYQYDPTTRSGSYNINNTPKPFDIYAHDIALKIKSITIDAYARTDSNTTDKSNITYTYKRTVKVQKIRQFVLPEVNKYAAEIIRDRAIEFYKADDAIKMADNLKSKILQNQGAVYEFTSTCKLNIAMAFNNGLVNIKSIQIIDDSVRCTNDADMDAILDYEDSLKNVFGDFTANGRPDYDLDGVPDSTDKCPNTYSTTGNKGCPPMYFISKKEFEGFVGLQLNSAKINLPELNQLGYRDQSGNDAVDVLQSKKGLLKNPGIAPGLNAGGNLTYYFGTKRRNSGITIGFAYTVFKAQYQLTEPIVYTFKSFDGVNFYRRQITISSLKEGINYNIFNFPAMFTYRLHADKKGKSVIKLQVGPSLMLFRNTTGYSAAIDLGGLYQIDTLQKNAITYYNYFDPGSTYNVLLTSKGINAQNSNPGASSIFLELSSKNYDFAENKSYSGKQNLTRITAAVNLAFDLQQKVSEGLTLKMGFHFVYAPLFERAKKYTPIDKTSEEFQSIYNSNAKSSYSAIGFNAGFVYNW